MLMAYADVLIPCGGRVDSGVLLGGHQLCSACNRQPGRTMPRSVEIRVGAALSWCVRGCQIGGGVDAEPLSVSVEDGGSDVVQLPFRCSCSSPDRSLCRIGLCVLNLS